VLSRAQYKGYVKVLGACLIGLENAFNTPGSNGLASLFHVLEIAHTHCWATTPDAANVPITPANDAASLLGTPSASQHDISKETNTPSAPPARPPPPRQESILENSRLSKQVNHEEPSPPPPPPPSQTNAHREPPKSLPLDETKPAAPVPEQIRTYLYQDLICERSLFFSSTECQFSVPTQNPLWQKMVFWENAFFDVVAKERDIIGMDQVQ
jgi:hypothetical protein